MICAYSRVEFITFLNKNNITDINVEDTNSYYISILPTGGPKAEPIFKESHNNVITLIFDDVEYDSVKDKHPDGVGTFIAKAFTDSQANELLDFIYKMDMNKDIHIHCVDGKRRSISILKYILETRYKPNKIINTLLEKNDNYKKD